MVLCVFVCLASPAGRVFCVFVFLCFGLGPSSPVPCGLCFVFSCFCILGPLQGELMRTTINVPGLSDLHASGEQAAARGSRGAPSPSLRYPTCRCSTSSCYWWLMTLYRKFVIINLLREVVGGRPLPLGCGEPRARPRFRQVSSMVNRLTRTDETARRAPHHPRLRAGPSVPAPTICFGVFGARHGA